MPTSEQQREALERLYENESLTDNLTDAPARSLLAWAEERLRAGVEPAAVFAAVRAANRAAPASSEETLAAAAAALGQGSAPPAAQQAASLQPQPPSPPAPATQTPVPANREPQQPKQRRRRILSRLRGWLFRRRTHG